MAVIQLLRQKFVNKLVTPNKTQWRLAQKSIGTIDRDTLISEAASHSRLSESELNSALNAVCDTAAMFLSIGHGVQLGNLGTLSLSISSKAVDSEAECTADTIRGNVGVNLRAIGRLAKSIAEFKFRVAGVSTESDQDGGTNGTGSNPSNPGSNPSTDEPVTYRIVFNFSDNSEDAHDYEVGETINYPTPTSGYHWPSDKPTVMPARNVSVTEEKDSQSSNYDDDAGF